MTSFGLRPVLEADVTSALTVLTPDDLAVRDSPYIADQLRAVPGVAVSRSGSVGGLTQIRIRGAEANHTLVLLDGIEVSDPVTGETDFGFWSGLDAARIEVLRGEQSALYGSDAIGGVIAIESRTDAGARGHVEAGTQDTYRLDGRYGAEFDQAWLVGHFSNFVTEGVDTSGRNGEKDGARNYSAALRGGGSLGDNWSLTGLARYGYGETDTDPDLDFDGSLDDGDRQAQTKQWLVGAALRGAAFGIDHVLRASHKDVTRENTADGSHTNNSVGVEKRVVYSPSIAVATNFAVHTFGAQVDFDAEDYETRDVEFGGLTSQSQTFRTLGLAAEYRFSRDGLAFNASVRHDDNDGRFDDAVTWRTGAAYTFRGIGARLRASIGKGVKNPTFTELFGFFPGSFIGNPDLAPEKSRSWEIGWDQAIGPAQTSLTYFKADLDDEIFTAFNPDFTSTARNRTGRSERSGFELGARWPVTGSLSLTGAATLTTSQNDTGQDEIRVPAWTGSVSADWQPGASGLRAGLAVDLVGDQDDFDFGAFPARRVELDAYALVSATAELPLSPRLAVTLRATNLLDQDTTDVLGFNTPGVAGLVGLRLR